MTAHLDVPHTIHTQADLETLWTGLMGDLGFSRTSLWLLFLEADGTVVKGLTAIDDLPTRPTDAVENLTGLLSQVVPPSGSVAFLLTRPGPDSALTPMERAWTRALQIVSRNVGTSVWPVHRANDEALHVCSPDELAA
jgi:hypothetical protein